MADGPVSVVLREYVGHRARPVHVALYAVVQRVGTEGVGQRLGALQVRDAHERVVLLQKVDCLALKRARQRGVAGSPNTDPSALSQP